MSCVCGHIELPSLTREALNTARIVCAAVRDEAGCVYRLPAPLRHVDVRRHMEEAHGFSADSAFACDHGFLLDTGHWVRRKPALLIAERAKQLLTDVSGPLLSEHLW